MIQRNAWVATGHGPYEQRGVVVEARDGAYRVLWLDGIVSGASAADLRVLRNEEGWPYGRWLVRRRPQFRWQPPSMGWRWTWVAVSPQPDGPTRRVLWYSDLRTCLQHIELIVAEGHPWAQPMP